MVRPVVIVEDLTEPMLTDLWNGCKSEEDSWDDIYGGVPHIVIVILEVSRGTGAPRRASIQYIRTYQGQVRVPQGLALKKSVLLMERLHSMGAYYLAE